ncbi:MAG: FtsX-like permease family protein [Solirubrobacteraceae bacterium]
MSPSSSTATHAPAGGRGLHRRASLRVWAHDLRFGAGLAFRGARLRTALTAIGIGLAVGVLLFATAVPHAIQVHQDRTGSRSYATVAATNSDTHPTPPTHGLLVLNSGTQWHDADISGLYLQQLSTDVPRPASIPRIPKPGELYVSPALRTLLTDPANHLLAERLPGRIVGTIDRSALGGPHDLYFYAGSSNLRAMTTDTGTLVSKVTAFGSDGGSPQLGSLLNLLVLIGSVVLLFPIAILVATAARFGSARRDRRLAALRLIGTTRAETARIAAGESLAAAGLGVALGALLLAGARQLVELPNLLGTSMFISDIRPNPVLVVVVVIGVLAISVGATTVSLKRVAIEPLSVSRRGGTGRRRLWWRPVPVVLGFAVLAPLLGGGDPSTDQHRLQVAAGAILVLSGVVLLLPWLVDAIVRRGRGWSPSSQLALRTLQPEATAASRIVSGVAVAVAGAITLQMLMASATGRVEYASSATPSTADAIVGYTGSPTKVPALRAAMARTGGVDAVHVFASQDLQVAAPSDGTLPILSIATCPDLGELTTVTTCRDGDVFRAVTPRTVVKEGSQTYVDQTVVPKPGDRTIVGLSSNGPHATHWQVPAGTTTVQARPTQGHARPGIYATPGAHVPFGDGTTQLFAYVHLDPKVPDALERVRTAAALFDQSTYVNPNDTIDDHRVLIVRRTLLAGSALLLLLIAASLIVTTFEQLGERRRTLATLAAFGTPAKILRRALWWQVAIPVALGLTLAVALGIPLGAILLSTQNEPFALHAVDTIALLALGAGMIVVVLAAALPFLQRVAAPSALRTE